MLNTSKIRYKSNSQQFPIVSINPFAVLNTSKIRYKSNSQPWCQPIFYYRRCAQYFKDTIQEQFTTGAGLSSMPTRLCSILQRYDTRAIHNRADMTMMPDYAVLNTSKIRYKSNSQREIQQLLSKKRCAQYFKDTIQEQFTTLMDTEQRGFQLCSILQRYDTRAIHNYWITKARIKEAVLNTSKIRYKSNSQPLSAALNSWQSCAQYFKDTIQEQFTTLFSFKLVPT